MAVEEIENMMEEAKKEVVGGNNLPFDLSMKKKKKKVVIQDYRVDNSVGQTDDRAESVSDHIEGEEDGYYTYDELLARLHENMRGDREKIKLGTPIVFHYGRETLYINFIDQCKTMHREVEHVMSFILAEWATTGSLDGEQRLAVKGRYISEHFRRILRKYIEEYVVCNNCKSVDTTLTKQKRLIFIQCEKCGSRRCVKAIDAGFVARIGSRKAGK